MPDDPILPTADKVLQPVLEKFYELRPRSFQHINLRSGIYWHPFLGWRAQAAKALLGLLRRTKANRLTTAEGQELIDYVASEYTAVPITDGTFAIGELSLTRSTTSVAGDVPKGTRFSRAANLKTQIPLEAATYETLIDVHFNVGQSTAGPVPVRALARGAGANHPIRTDSIPHGVTANGLFDSTITVSSFSAAGGTDKAEDDYVRDFAQAYSAGQYGPTEAASRYGALAASGVRNILVYDIPGSGTERILVADESWASSDRWAALVQQSIYDNNLVGFGCKVEVAKIRNVVISVEVTVVLRDTNYMTETTEIDEAIRTAVREYFDERVDWNVWGTDGLKSTIARCHYKILNCTAATVKDTTGATVSEITTPNFNVEQFHYYLANGAVKATYTGPS